MPSRSAAARACALARTLKPMIGASDAAARLTSDSVMPPTPACMICAATSSVPSFSSACTIASTEPCTSPLMTIGERRLPCTCRRWIICSSEPRAPAACATIFSRRRRWRYSVTSRARASLSTTPSRSPASGVAWKPSTATGVDGPASRTCSPRSSISARTRPHSPPATTMSPTCSVPRWTSTVATGPRPRSSCASTTVPSAGRSGLACRLRISACSRIASRSLSRLVRLVAETSTSSVSPPIDSTTISWLRSSVLTRVGSAPCLSILLIATMIGTPAARAWLMDFNRLRHDAVVGGDHEHRDIGRLRAAGAHGRERLVAGRVDEGDLLAVLLDLVGADMLGDAARLGRDDVRLADRIEQRRLAVVDMAHDRDDRRTRLQRLLGIRRVEQPLLDVGGGDAADVMAKLFGDDLRGVGVEHVGDLDELAILHEEPDHVDGALRHAVGELLHGDRLGDHDVARDLLLRRRGSHAPGAAASRACGARKRASARARSRRSRARW